MLAVDPPHVERPLRDYQAIAIDDLRNSLRSGHKRPVLQAPTAYGKTRLAAEVVGLALSKGRRTVFVVPALSLIDQTVEAFWQDGIRDVGVIQANHAMTDWSRPVQVASVQTLARRTWPECDLAIIDECHRRFESLEKWMAATPIPFIGLSATPWTKGLGKIFDDLIISATIQELIDQKYLSPFRVFAPSHPDLSGIKTVAGDYQVEQLADRMNQEPLVADVVETWLLRGEGRPTLCFAVDRAHAKHLQQRFLDANVSCGYQDAYTDSGERRVIRERFHRGEYNVVCNVGTLTTGVDWDVRCIILARPTKSEILYVQIIGRGLRTAEGKDNCLVLDHSDTTNRLGFVTDINHAHLDDGKPKAGNKRKPPLPKECPKCHFLRPPKVSKCPACGFVPEVKSNVEVADGELVELTTLQRKRYRAGMIELRGVEIPLGEFFGELKSYARQRGYKPGWAANKYREATGVWPNAHKYAPERQTSFVVESWLKAAQIRWIKSKAKVGVKQNADH